MNRIPRVACINDLTGFGRCSLTTAISILASMGVQPCPVPTAILSKHTQFPSYTFLDFTSEMQDYFENWQDVDFDALYSGFLGSKEQIEIVLAFVHSQQKKKEKPLFILDTVMGDNGKPYATYTKEMCNKIRSLVPYADIITPNITEACILTDTDYMGESLHTKDIIELLQKLETLGCRKIVLTGIERSDLLCNAVLEDGNLHFETVKKTARYFSGTGDMFASIVTASIVTKHSLKESVALASDFISKVTAHTLENNTPFMDGVCFEPFLHTLNDQKKSEYSTLEIYDL